MKTEKQIASLRKTIEVRARNKIKNNISSIPNNLLDIIYGMWKNGASDHFVSEAMRYVHNYIISRATCRRLFDVFQNPDKYPYIINNPSVLFGEKRK